MENFTKLLEGKFQEEDQKKFVEFLNFIAERAIFPDWKTEDTIKHFKLISYMQQVILPKINKNIADLVKVVEPEDNKSDENIEENKEE